MSKSSNLERTKRRSECRQMLSEHLYTKLGLVIGPAEVRLHPRHDDAYKWSVLPHKKYLFENNLSKLTAGFYTQLMQGIGVFFEAVPNTPTTSAAVASVSGFDGVKNRNPGMETFTSSIVHLQEEVALLKLEAGKWHHAAEKESRERIRLESELKKAKMAYFSLRKDTLRFRSDARKSADTAQGLYTKLRISSKGIQRVADFLEKLVEVAKP